MNERTQYTLDYLATRPYLFDRITKDKTGGRVGWISRPKDYDNQLGLPWSGVRGRYWYPWK